MGYRFKDKVILVTGGSSGIGQRTALHFAKEGAKIVISSRNKERAEKTLTLIRNAGAEAYFVQADSSKSDQVEGLINFIEDRYKRLDCAFNNAGGYGGEECLLTELPEQSWEKVMAENLTSVWLSMKYEIPLMLKMGGGVIINNSSVAGLHASPLKVAYSTSKHGVIGLTKTAALEFAGKNIRINVVCPGWIKTPPIESSMRNNPALKKQICMFDEPIGRIGEPEEIANAVLWLCSDEASFVTGHIMVVDGGFSLK